ncbi:hypothetical protein Q3G72_005719 [Acer saccharum]|nr:hypothetical protein Q3G72_005719 [Acer saccharum]
MRLFGSTGEPDGRGDGIWDGGLVAVVASWSCHSLWLGRGPSRENIKDNERSARQAGGRSCGQVLGEKIVQFPTETTETLNGSSGIPLPKGLRIPNPVGPDGLVCPSLANRIPAQRHCLCAPSPYRSRSVFSTAGEAVVEAKPIAKPTIKYEIGPLLKDLMEWPSPPKSAYVIWELIA